MPKRLKRYYGLGHLHFITFSCYRRMALLGTVRSRKAFVRALDEVHAKYRFALVGYVVMPEHVHLLIAEPKHGNPSGVVHSLKLRVSKRMHRKGLGMLGSQRSFVFHAPARVSGSPGSTISTYGARKSGAKSWTTCIGTR